MQTHESAAFTANPVLTLEDLGLEPTVSLDEASRGLAERSEAQIVRWVQFPAGALFFVLAQGDPSSGAVYIFDRRTGGSTSWSSTTRTGAATVWPSTRRLNECIGFRGSHSGRGCSTGGANRGKRTDRHPDPLHLRGF